MAAPATGLFNLLADRSFETSPGLVASALEHRVGGQLLDAVQAGRTTIAAEEARGLMLSDLNAVSHHRELWSGLSSATGALNEAGISCFAIKGVVEEARLYDRLGERPCADVDLVISPGALGRVDEAMGLLCPDHPRRHQIVELVNRRVLQHVDITWEGVAIDLHFDPLKIGLWTRQGGLVDRTTTTVEGPSGQTVAVLAPELALVAFLTHLNKDRFSYLGAYGDVARLATRSDLDWDLVHRFVEGEGLQVPAYKSLAVVNGALELGLEVPSVGGWRSVVWDRLWPEDVRLLGREGRSARRQRQNWIPMLSQHRWAEVASESKRQLLPPRQLLDLHRPDLQDHGLVRRLTIDRTS